MSKAPIFESIFGLPWAELPPVMQKHYAVRPFSADRVMIRGFMTIKRSRAMRLLSPLLNVFGALLPFDGEKIPAKVTFYSGLKTADFHFDRTVEPPGRPAFRFQSKLVQMSGNDVVEFMRFGIGWRAHYTISGNRVSLRHIGYVWRIGTVLIPLPLSFFIGAGSAAEEALTENSFKMWMAITHPVFGETYRYEGTFDIAEVTLA